MNNAFDSFFYHLINQVLTNSVLDYLMVKFSDKFFWIPLYILMIILIVKKYGKLSLLIIFCLGLTVLLADRITSGWIKPMIKRERPCHVAALHPRVLDPCNDTGSMPSSHAANHFGIGVFFILLYGFKRKKLVIFWLAWAIAIAYSRVYCGVHYPTDVIVGGTIGAIIGWSCFKLYELSKKQLRWN